MLPQSEAAAEGLSARKSPRVVLDSNVWIDILVFKDPDSAPIHQALEAAQLTAVIDAPCLYELTRVLDYPQFARFNVDKAEALACVARLSTFVEGPAPSALALPLPRCSDRDDQKFLELAASAGVDWLVTKDRALLKLAKRFHRDFACRIDRPPGFVCATLTAPAALSD